METPTSNYDLQVDMAKKIFLEYDQELLIRKFSLDADDRWIFLLYLNTPCRISRTTGSVEELTEKVLHEARVFIKAAPRSVEATRIST